MQDIDRCAWRRTRRLAVLMLLFWAFFALGVHTFVRLLNAVSIAHMPLGFYMAAQGSLVAFVIMGFVFARRQDRIDGDGALNEGGNGDGEA